MAKILTKADVQRIAEHTFPGGKVAELCDSHQALRDRAERRLELVRRMVELFSHLDKATFDDPAAMLRATMLEADALAELEAANGAS